MPHSGKLSLEIKYTPLAMLPIIRNSPTNQTRAGNLLCHVGLVTLAPNQVDQPGG